MESFVSFGTALVALLATCLPSWRSATHMSPGHQYLGVLIIVGLGGLLGDWVGWVILLLIKIGAQLAFYLLGGQPPNLEGAHHVYVVQFLLLSAWSLCLIRRWTRHHNPAFRP